MATCGRHRRAAAARRHGPLSAGALRHGAPRGRATFAMSGDRPVLSRLRELIAALDRRAPHLERAGERRIARDAAHLKALAEERISQIEAPGGDGPAKGVMTCPSCQTPHPVPADDASATDS